MIAMVTHDDANTIANAPNTVVRLLVVAENDDDRDDARYNEALNSNFSGLQPPRKSAWGEALYQIDRCNSTQRHDEVTMALHARAFVCSFHSTRRARWMLAPGPEACHASSNRHHPKHPKNQVISEQRRCTIEVINMLGVDPCEAVARMIPKTGQMVARQRLYGDRDNLSRSQTPACLEFRP